MGPHRTTAWRRSPSSRISQSVVSVGCDHADPELKAETMLTADQRAALQSDLDA